MSTLSHLLTSLTPHLLLKMGWLAWLKKIYHDLGIQQVRMEKSTGILKVQTFSGTVRGDPDDRMLQLQEGTPAITVTVSL